MRTCTTFATLALAVVLTVPAMATEPTVATPTSPEATKLARGPFKPDWKSLQQYRCPDWFRNAKFGIWAHWGPQAVPRQGDWYARNMYQEGSDDYKHHLATYGHPSKSGYKDIIPLWKADKWEPDRLMELYRKAGARYFVAQAVHCDNFDLWDSKFQRWNAVQMGPKRDMVGTWKQAALKQGMRFGVSEHLGYSRCWFQTSHGADKTGHFAGVPYDGADARWRTLYHPADPLDCCRYSDAPDWQREWFNRIEDLVDHYQPDLLYSDGGIPFGEVGRSLVAHFYNESIRTHGGRLEAVYNCKLMKDSGDFVESVSVQDVERGAMREIQPLPWQTDTSNGDWYFRENDRYKTAAQVIRLLADIVSKNGNMLLNIVQYPDGSLPPESATLLKELAAWMSINGEAIHGTRPWRVYGEGPTVVAGGHFKEEFPFTARDIRFSTKGDALYALVLGWPDDGRLRIRALATSAGKIASVELLGASGELDWSQQDNGLRVTLPKKKPCDHAYALKITGHGLQPAPLPTSGERK